MYIVLTNISGKCRSGKCGTKPAGYKARKCGRKNAGRKNVGMEMCTRNQGLEMREKLVWNNGK